MIFTAQKYYPKGVKIFKRIAHWVKLIACILAVGGIAILLGVNYWKQQNPTNEIAAGIKPFPNSKITTGPTPHVQYGEAVDLPSSPSQIKQLRYNKSMPLYLKGYVNVPSAGVYEQIYEGTSPRVLAVGAGTIKPGQAMNKIGNYAIAAHNLYDYPYGHDFSGLQFTNPVGKYAYLTDGKTIYTYKIVNRLKVWYYDSIKYALDDWEEQYMSDHGLNNEGADKIKTNSIADVNSGKIDNNGKYTYTKELTLYTCFEQPPELANAHYRIIVQGVQIEAQPGQTAPEWKRQLFPAVFGTSNQATIPPTKQKLTPYENKLRQDPEYFNNLLKKVQLGIVILIVIYIGLTIIVFILNHIKWKDPADDIFNGFE